MKLYYAPGACSLAPHIVLREADLPFELKKVDNATKKVADGADYWRVNEKGYVPALELDDGQVLTEGPAIMQYLADLKPDTGLAPKAGTMERYRLMEWLNFLTTEVHKQFGPLWSKDTPEEWKKALREKIGKRFDWLSKKISGGSYLTGKTFTVADAYLFVLLNWCHMLGIDLTKWPMLHDYHARVGARPKVQEALKNEGLLK